MAAGVKRPEKDPSGKLIPHAGPGSLSNTIGYPLREMLRKEIRVTVLNRMQRGGSRRLSTASSARVLALPLPIW